MNANQLIQKFNNEFGLKDWPKDYEVSVDTFAKVCSSIFIDKYFPGALIPATVMIGPHGGIMFKNVELRLNIDLKDKDYK